MKRTQPLLCLLFLTANQLIAAPEISYRQEINPLTDRSEGDASSAMDISQLATLNEISLTLDTESPTSEVVYHQEVNLEITDGSTSGVISTIDITELGTIHEVSITLNIEVPAGAFGFLGDVYVHLQHGDDIAVLLNRPGRDIGAPAGYDDDVDMSVTFNDDAAMGDIHNYRLALNGNQTVALSIPISGIWQPDGRSSDPDTVQLGDPRDAMLEVFTGDDVDGLWTLFVADVSAGGRIYLSDWTITASVVAVPEPRFNALIGLLALAFAINRERS